MKDYSVFAQDFLKWCQEQNAAINGYLKIDYLAYRSHAIAVESTFKRISGSYDFEKVDRLENGYINLCNNGGLFNHMRVQLLNMTILNTHSFYIPIKRGIERHVDIKIKNFYDFIRSQSFGCNRYTRRN